MDAPRQTEVVTAQRLLLAVGLGYLLVQVVALSVQRPPSWDEAIYLSQVAPGADRLPFVPSRARGITFLAVPVLQLGGSLGQLRLFLAVASAAALVASFRLWARVIGLGAAAAAALFAAAWPALFYGSELMPNLWLALIAVAATAVLGRRLARGEGRYDELAAGSLVALAALFRPLDAVVLTAALVLLPIAVRRGTIAWTVHLLLGLAAGWAPWFVEMTGRFGSPIEALSAAARLGHTGRWSLFVNARQYLALSDGPSIGPVADPEIPLSGLLALLGLISLGILGLRTARRRGFLSSVVVPSTAGLGLAAGYIVFTDAQAPRFLLPALALLAVPAGLGLVSIAVSVRERSPTPARVAAVVAASVLVATWAVLQVRIATRVEGGVTAQRASAALAGREIRTLAARQPCHVYSEASFPIVGFAAGCRASPLGKILGAWQDRADHLAGDGIRAFLVLHQAEQPAAPRGARLIGELPSRGDLTWFIYDGG